MEVVTYLITITNIIKNTKVCCEPPLVEKFGQEWAKFPSYYLD